VTEADHARLLTDPARVPAVLEGRLPWLDGGLRIDACRVIHARLRTSPADRRHRRPFLLVAWELSVCDARGEPRGRRIVHARVYGDGRGDRTELWSFPDDPRLPHLAEAVDPSRVRRHLPYDHLPAGFGAGELTDVGVEVVRYKPEVRCTTRYELRSAAGTFVLYGKTFKHGVAGEMARRVEGVSTALAGDPEGFVVPRPMGFSERARTIWQAELRGSRVAGLLAAGARPDLAAAAGRALARFHRVTLAGLRRVTPAERLAAVTANAAELGRAHPALAGRLAAVCATAQRDLERLGPAREALVHADFLPKQLIAAGGGRLGVFDFDGFVVGDPLQDVTCFVLDEARTLPPATARAFLRAYRAHAGCEVADERLRWNARVQALDAAFYWHKRRHYDAGFAAELARIVALAEDPPLGQN
jgi:hypothetical protein